MATTAGIAKQGMSAAIVLNAIEKISEMINRAESAMVSSIDSEIVAAIDFAATNPEVAKLSYRDPYYGVQGARGNLHALFAYDTARTNHQGALRRAWHPNPRVPQRHHSIHRARR